MKYCKFCGQQVADEAVICVHCGRAIEEQVQSPRQNSNLNVLCLLGFIMSFFLQIVGLILSIVGYNQVKNSDNNTNKNLAKAGIIISSVGLGLVLLYILFLFYFWFILMIALI